MLRKAKVCALDQLLLEQSGGQVRAGALLATPPLAEHHGAEHPDLKADKTAKPGAAKTGFCRLIKASIRPKQDCFTVADTPKCKDDLYKIGVSGAYLLDSLAIQRGVRAWRRLDPFLGVNCVNLPAP